MLRVRLHLNTCSIFSLSKSLTHTLSILYSPHLSSTSKQHHSSYNLRYPRSIISSFIPLLNMPNQKTRERRRRKCVPTHAIPNPVPTDASNVVAFRILHLPVELRLHIYEEYFESFFPSLPLHVRHINWWQRAKETVSLPPLFFVSKQLYAESRPIVTNSMRLHIWLKRPGLMRIPDLSKPKSKWSESDHRLFEQLGSMRNVKLSMDIDHGRVRPALRPCDLSQGA